MALKSLLVLLVAVAVANCQRRMLSCTSTWSGQRDVMPACSTVSASGEDANQCPQEMVWGQHNNLYTVEALDKDLCLSVLMRVEDRSMGATPVIENYMYRGPLIGDLEVTYPDCASYCKGLRDNALWFLNVSMTLTPIYVGCWAKVGDGMTATNVENLDKYAAATTASKFNCATDVDYARSGSETDTQFPGTAPARVMVPPVTDENKITISEKRTGDDAIPGWHFAALGVQLAVLIISALLCIYSVVLYIGFKGAISPGGDMEMK